MIQIRGGSAAVIATVLVTFAAHDLRAQSLKGSAASVDRMHSVATQSGLDFFRSASTVTNAVGAGKLVKLTGNSDYELDTEVQYPYLLSEGRLFVERLGGQYRASCGERLVVTGATRPMDMKLANASDKSVHPTGMAVDLRSANIPSKCLKWIRSTLLDLEKTGVLEVTEEKRPHHFHVAIFPTAYGNYVAAQGAVAVAQTRSAVSGPAESPDAQVVTYLVRSGDSLWRIATKNDTTVKAIQELNKMRSDTIYPGQVILVPKLNGSK